MQSKPPGKSHGRAAIEEARAFGIDVSLLEEALRLTPDERLARLQANVTTIASARRVREELGGK
jgi:hypothetical protein